MKPRTSFAATRRWLLKTRRRSPTDKFARPPEVTEAQRVLADRLQARVRVDMSSRKGKIVIDFATLDELDRLVGAMLGDSRDSGVSTISID